MTTYVLIVTDTHTENQTQPFPFVQCCPRVSRQQLTTPLL